MQKVRWNRLLSLILAVLLVFGCALPAYAVDAGEESDSDAALPVEELLPPEAVRAVYQDGVYEGTGTGYGGDITLRVTISDGAVTRIETVSQQETPRYWQNAQALFSSLEGVRSAEEVDQIDGVSGATRSSNGIKAAVKDALSKAGTQEPEPSPDPSPAPDDSVFASGSGTQDDPYILKTSQQLRDFAASVNAGESYAGAYVRLDADVDISDAEWTPIGHYDGDTSVGFCGVFDGSGYTVSGLTIGTAAEPADLEVAGLFGVVGDQGRIYNLGVTNARIYNRLTDTETRPNAGVLAASLEGSSAGGRCVVDNCYATGYISCAGQTDQYGYVGGLVGGVGWGGLISNSWADVDIETNGNCQQQVGGIVGQTGNETLVMNCAAFGDVSAAGWGWHSVGGIAGMSCGAVINCYATGNTTTDAISYGDMPDVGIGALVGSTAYEYTAYGCYFNQDSVQTVNSSEVQDTVYAIGMCEWTYTPGDDTYCTGMAGDAFASAEFAEQLNSGLSEEQLAAAEAYFIDENGIVSTPLSTFAAMTDSGWQTWSIADGRLVPSGGAPEPDVGPFASGAGTEANPYLIRTEQQLRDFAASVNAGESYAGKVIRLDSSIALSDTAWTPIGETADVAFAGTFLGDGNTVSNVKIGSETAPSDIALAGFFGVLCDGATVSDLHLRNVAIYQSADDGVRAYGGGLAAQVGTGRGAAALVDRCSVSGIVSVHTTDSYAYAGGMAANLVGNSVLSNDWADVSATAVSAQGMSMAGGLYALGANGNFVANCAALGNVSASGYNFSAKLSVYAGGLAAMPGGLIYNCAAFGDVAITNQIESESLAIGGAVGAPYATVVNVYYNADAAQTVNGEAVAEKTGLGASNVAYPSQNVTAKSAKQMATADFAALMGSGLSQAKLRAADTFLCEQGYDAGKFASLCGSVPAWYAWSVADGPAIPAGGVYVEPEAKTFFESGDGTAEDPYLIMTVEQLKAFARDFSDTEDYAGVHVALGADLDISGEARWMPIGETETDAYYFNGTFDGRNHTISGLTVGSADDPYTDGEGSMCFGLFGALGESGTVKNLGVTNVQMFVNSDYSVLAGAVAGLSQGGGIDGCYATGTIVSETFVAGNNYVGGLVGEAMYGYIVNSWTDVDLDSSSKTYNAEAGGIAGLAAFGIVANCYALGNASGWTDRTVDDGGVTYLSGLLGCQAGDMVNCYTMGDMVSRSWSQMVGSLAGMSTGISLSCYNYYNSEALQEIDGMRVDPVEAIGYLVGGGVSEDGDSFDGAVVVGNEAKTAAELASQAMADLLNANFANFPIDIANELPDGVTLRQWVVRDGVVTLGDEAAEVTYVPVEVPSEPVVYIDGTYYGRAAGTDGAYVLVKAVVEGGRVVSLEVVSHAEPAGFDALAKPLIDQTLEQQEAPAASEDASVSETALVNAIKVVLNKALLGDTTGYDPVDPSIFAGGTGTAEDPYQIATAEQLRAFAASVNAVEDYAGKYVVLTADISLAGEAWTPVGGAGAHIFSGVFDGQYHVISNMTIGTEDVPASYVSAGLFAYLDGAVVKNLGVKDAYIHVARSDDTRIYAGIIAGVTDSYSGMGALIDHCAVSGTLVGQSDSWCELGGIAGYVDEGVISNCGAIVDITAVSTNGSVDAGGIVALDGFAGLLNNYAAGTITATAGVNAVSIGGLAGMQAGVAVNNYTDVKLVSTRASIDVGGITGRNTGIAALYSNYYSSDAEQRSGNTVLTPAVGIGTNVTMVSTGIVENVEDRTSEELRSEAFRDLLNSNRNSETLKANWAEGLEGYEVVLPEMPEMEEWIISASGRVIQKNTPDLDAHVHTVVIDPAVAPTCTEAGLTEGSHCAVCGEVITAQERVPALGHTWGAWIVTTPATCDDAGVETRTCSVCGETETREIAALGHKCARLTDIDMWAKENICYVVENGYMTGMSETTFEPDTTTSRAMVVMVLYNMAGAPDVTGLHNPFADVAADKWYTDAIIWAANNGIAAGMSKTTFEPETDVTRAQMVAFLMRYAAFQKEDVSARADLSGYTDAASVPDWALENLQWAVAEGIVTGVTRTMLAPNETATRAQLATILTLYLMK